MSVAGDHSRLPEGRRALLEWLGANPDLFASIIDLAPVAVAVLVGPDHRYALVNEAYTQLARGNGVILGRTLTEVWPEAGSEIAAALDRVRVTGEAVRGTEQPFRVDRGSGPETIWLNYLLLPAQPLPGVEGGILLLAQEVTDRVRAAETARVRAGWLEAIRALTTALGGTRTREEVARVVLDKGLAALGAGAAWVARVNPAGAVIEPIGQFGYSGSVNESRRGLSLALRTPVTDAIRCGALVWVGSPREALHAFPEWGPTVVGGPHRAWAAVPLNLQHRDGTRRTIGALGLSFAAERSYDREFGDLLLLVGDQCAQALDRVFALEALDVTAGHGGLERSFGTYSFDPIEGRAVWSRELYEWFGLPATEEPAPDLWLQRIVPADRPAFDRMVAAALDPSGVGHHELEFRVVRADGNILWLRDTGRTAFEGEGAARRAVRVVGTIWDVTARKQTEVALHVARERLEAALDASQVVLFHQDLELRYTWIHNPALGYAAQEVVGARDGELFERPEDAARLEGIKRDVIETGQGRREEVRVERAGQMRFYDLVVQPSRDAAGHITGVNCAAVDITSRKHTEEALRASERRYRSLLDATSAVSWTCPPSGLQENVQPAWLAFTGQTAEQASGVGWIDAIHPDQAAPMAARWFEAVARGEPFAGEFRVRRHDGRWRWMEMVAAPVHGASGAVVEWFCVGFDIAARKEAEEALRERERELQTLADNSPDILARFDRNLQLVFVNAAAVRVAGRSREELLGGSDPERGVPYELCAAWDGAIRSVFALGQAQSLDFQVDSDGGSRHYSCRLVPEYGPSGEVASVLGVAVDVTDRRLLVEALRQADRRTDEFLATLSHELRNPLAPLRTGLQLLRMAQLDGQTAGKALDMMDRQLAHMVRLIDDLLDVSRIGRGLVELRRQRVELKVAVDAAVEATLPLVTAHAHELVVHLPEEALWLDADPTRLAQVFRNLLTNAAKYTPNGGRIELRARRDGDEVVVVVADDGVGILPDRLESIFEMFAQNDHTMDRAQGGLGIGLALVRRLVEKHGGSIRAASEGLGKGSTFTVRLPAWHGRDDLAR